MSNIKVVDSIMGSGKTTAAINYINQSNDDKKFLFVTPYLTEVERVINACEDKHFVQPSVRKNRTKKKHLKELLKQGNNVACTHSLFSLADEGVLKAAKKYHYVLIVDEALDCFKDTNINWKDVDILMKYLLDVNDQNICCWKDNSYNGILKSYKPLFQQSCCMCVGKGIFHIVNPSLFISFDDVCIMTYMFEGQPLSAYLKLCNLGYDYYHVQDDTFVKGYKFDNGEKYKDKIHICDNFKMNMVGRKEKYDFKRDDTSLSKGWYVGNNSGINTVRKNCSNFFKNIHKARKGEYLWTTFKEYKDLVKGCGYSFGYAPLNLRATNDYGERKYIAYLVNRFLNPYLKKGLENKEIVFDEDKYALSEMLQFIWRSKIRYGKDIYLYVPSVRMRILLKEWLGYPNIDQDIEMCRI